MKIAIHHRPGSFSARWIEYCEVNNIDHKVVNCYSTDIIKELNGYDALMWHFHHSNPKDVLFAKQLIYALQAAGKKVFPDFHTCWHFDDKVGQKYLLETVGAPLVPSYVFYRKEEAMQWVKEADFPKVFKLRRGAGSSHVKLVADRREAKKLIRKAFRSGFTQYNAISKLRERWRQFKLGNTGVISLVKGIVRLGYKTEFSKVVGNEKGYVYFQDYIAENDYDIRVIVIGDKAFAIKRGVREKDFRASGSGIISFDKELFSDETIRLSFEIAKKLKSQCLAIDFVFKDETPLIVEISYGFTQEVYDKCEGYWDCNLNWYKGPFNPQGWMVESLLHSVN